LIKWRLTILVIDSEGTLQRIEVRFLFFLVNAFREACGLSYVEQLHSSEVLADICENFEIPIIFVKTDSAKEFYRSVIESGFQVGTVVYGDSDLDLDISCIPFQHIVRKAFVQNLNIKHSRLEPLPLEIGRATCRERVEVWVGGVSV